ncbi:MAG TPA: HAMP domain-containing sensor histidine kinase [Rhizomicrobium sp.]|jgi:signal transduction histidine kinase|nr:HAMP domain-containing sensor histidine kinase [Rhizomicrobium sp.]
MVHALRLFEQHNPHFLVLVIAVVAAAFFIIGLGLFVLMFKRQKAHVRALEEAKAKLETLSDNLRLALEEAESAGRAKATFFASMSHELRTPLNAIIGFSEILRAELFGPVGSARNAEYIGDIHQSGLRLLALVNDVLDVSRMDADKMQLTESEFVVGDMIASVLRVVEQQAANAGVALTCPDKEDPTRIKGDRQRLEQALLNLLSNAIKFTPDGHVDVTVHHDAKGIQIAVEDTGIGIAEKDISRILEPFVQADNRLARKYEGSGLGLTITRRLVELHGGKLTLHSRLNIGTIVTMHLPASRVVPSRINSAA